MGRKSETQRHNDRKAAIARLEILVIEYINDFNLFYHILIPRLVLSIVLIPHFNCADRIVIHSEAAKEVALPSPSD